MFKRGGVWWTCIRYKGKKIQKSLETTDKKLAQAIEAKVRTELIEGKYFEKHTGDSKTFRDMMEKFMKEHAPNVSTNMQTSYNSSLKHLNPYFGDKKLSEISQKKISEYKVLRKSEGAKPATINRELAMLSKAFNLAFKEWEWIKENPVSKVPKEKEDNEKDRWLTGEEEKKLLENSPQWLKDIIVFNLHTGLRIDELLSLEWQRVNLFSKTILIQKSKNGKPRTVPLNQDTIDILTPKSKVISIKNDLVFTSSAGTKIDSDNLRRSLGNALEKAGIKDVTPHTLRHTFATRLSQRGVDIYKIAKLLGHKDIRMTLRYAHHCPDSLRDGVRVLEADYNSTTVEEKREVSNA
ncbi:MAG TPA: tyrosine-type recombinase/integrase [Candidatus Wunengus sp. YC60]|uniref:tyrosine-type recombinase/integrase n=1 Tax=Candidatus Wunengus sp. YC60 TaxID=3367697 RepID=UPI004028DFF0